MTKENETGKAIDSFEEPQSGTPLLSRAECNIMRGFAIIIIIINNFTHLFKGVFPDNEYSYNQRFVQGFLDNLSHPDRLLPFNLLSFLCPYGVMLFIFLSGYGLALKYEKGSGQGVSHKSFLFSHYNKMFSMQLKGLGLYLVFCLLTYPQFVPETKHLLLQTFFVGSLNPYQDSVPGPYWFFGMIVEMYFIYRLLIYRRKDIVMWVLVILSLVAMACCSPNGWQIKYLRVNCFLAMLPFCMGVYAARHLDSSFLSTDKAIACVGWLLLSSLLLILCKFNFYTWLFLPIFIIATAVTIVKLMSRVKLLNQAFSWLGALSGVLFVVHPAIRIALVGRANASGDYYGMVFVYLLVTFALSIMLKPVFSGKKK